MPELDRTNPERQYWTYGPLIVVEAMVYAERDGKREPVAKLNATMAVVRPSREPTGTASPGALTG